MLGMKAMIVLHQAMKVLFLDMSMLIVAVKVLVVAQSCVNREGPWDCCRDRKSACVEDPKNAIKN